MNKYLRVLLAFAVCIFVLSACEKSLPKENAYRKSTVLMDTVVAVTAVSDSPEKAEEAINAVFLELNRLQNLLSFWDKKSEISKINENAGIRPVKVSPETIDIIEKSEYVSKATDGAFDATIGPVIRLWDFKHEIMPTSESVKTVLPLVDYRKMTVNPEEGTAYLTDERMSFDTGGIAKGFAADAAVKVLKEHGIKAGLVSVAGDIKAFGHKPDGGQWKVGIRNPRPEGEEDAILGVIGLNDEAISTSGDYERFFMRDGTRYHHLLDPKTGMPAMGAISVSVLSKDSVLADGFSTGVFILGPERGMEVLRENGLDGIIIDSHGVIHMTDGIKDRVELKMDSVKVK